MSSAGTLGQGSVYGLLVGLGARGRSRPRAALAREVARCVAEHFGALLLTLHGLTDGWAEATADPHGVLARLGALDRARVETLDARLMRLAVERDGRVSALDLDPELEAEGYLVEVLGTTDAFAVPLRAAGRPAGAIVIYLGPTSAPPSETDLMALAGLGDVLALASTSVVAEARTGIDLAPPSGGFLRRLFRR